MGNNKLLFRKRQELISERKEAIEVLKMLIEAPTEDSTSEELKEWQEQIKKLEVELTLISNKIHINDLKGEITDEQIARLIKRPFYSEKENESFQFSSLFNYRTNENVYIHKKVVELIEIAISENYYLSNSIKIRLDYKYWTYYDGDRETPRHWNDNKNRRFFIINTNGEMEKDVSDQDENEVYNKIAFTTQETT